ncbi:MAG: Sec-independent protein translocase subunit TatA [Pseudonocardiaceae bacterium]
MLSNLAGWHFVILLGVLVLMFGAKKLPEAARSLGQSARVFKGEMKGLRDEEQPAPQPATAALPVTPPALAVGEQTERSATDPTR